jgi:flagellar biosynthesis chaperone FliJ
MTGLVISASTPGARIGDVVVVAGGDGPIRCEVVGFRDDDVLLVPLGASRAIGPGASALRQPAIGQLAVGDELLGRLVDPFGAPLDGLPPPRCRDRVELDQPALPVHLRAEVTQRFDTGIRVIDGLLTCGRGQRIGVFAGAGCGKSVLVEQIASHSAADVVVIGLIGERGREVRDLLARTHGARLVAVAATADRSPLERVRGALAATAIAEYFRDRGGHVLLVLDSLTRYAMALREVGLSLGEPPATKGYPPSVFATLPRLLERVAPRAGGGSITGFYTVLVEGDDLADSDRRLGPLAARRPRRAVARPGRARPLPGGRRAGLGLARRRQGHRGRRTSPGPGRARAAGPAPPGARAAVPRRLPPGRQPHARPGPGRRREARRLGPAATDRDHHLPRNPGRPRRRAGRGGLVMTIRPRVVRAVRAARAHLRDVAAAEHAHRRAEADLASRDLVSATDVLDAHLAAAPDKLAGATSVSQVIRVIAAVDLERRVVAEAATSADQAADRSRQAADQLRTRERALRTVDRVAERLQEARTEAESRAEQVASDELAARPRAP